MTQYNKIEQCMASTVCRINKRAKVGKSVVADMCALKKLWLVMRLYENEGYYCDISCLLTKNCSC